MLMKSRVEACRALTYLAYGLHGPSPRPSRPRRTAGRPGPGRIPHSLVQAGSTEMARTGFLAIQVHGGMGYIEETGVAHRAAGTPASPRSTKAPPEFRPTTSCSASFSATPAPPPELMPVAAAARELAAVGDPELAAIGARPQSRGCLDGGPRGTAARAGSDPAGCGWRRALSQPRRHRRRGWQLGRRSGRRRPPRRGSRDGPRLAAKIASARFYAEHVLPQASAWVETVAAGRLGWQRPAGHGLTASPPGTRAENGPVARWVHRVAEVTGIAAAVVHFHRYSRDGGEASRIGRLLYRVRQSPLYPLTVACSRWFRRGRASIPMVR